MKSWGKQRLLHLSESFDSGEVRDEPNVLEVSQIMTSLRVSLGKESVNLGTFSWRDQLLESVSIRSLLRGRIRFHLGFAGDEVLSDTLRRELQKLPTVKLETYSVRTRNALVTFDPKSVSELGVVTALYRGIKEFARVHGECDLDHHHHDRYDKSHSNFHSHSEFHSHSHGKSHSQAENEEECDHDHSALSTDSGIRKELFKLVFTGGLLGYFLFRKLSGKKLLFPGNPLLDVASLLTVFSGYPIFRAGVRSVQNQKKATDDTLISIAVIATLIMGESLTGLSVVWLINLGRLLEAITLKRSRTAVKDLMDITPDEAWLVSSDLSHTPLTEITRVPVEKVEKKQIIRIFQCEKIPLDGKILRGNATVQEAFITGEAVPKEKAVEDTVYAGSLVTQGCIDIEVTNIVHNTVIARMIQAIENIRDRKAPIEKVGTRFASQFVPISIGISVLTLLFTGDLKRAITMLVIACPCAAGLATPTAVSASIGQAARKGILIKGGTHLESAAKIDTVIFDKTGTLTQGEPTLQKFIKTERGMHLGEETCIQLAASAEQHTTHPLGLVLVSKAKDLGIPFLSIQSHKIHPGLGVAAQVTDQKVHVGNRKFMESLQISIPSSFDQEVTQGFIAGESILYLAIEGHLQGAFIAQDSIRSEATKMLENLRSMGIQRILLASGDQKIAADHIARQLGIQEVHAELLPEDKLKLVSDLKRKGYRVAMVGDGVNDAQALTEADVSIAMGGGRCDVAIEAADITLARNDLLLIPEVFNISKKTLETIYQNFFASVGINAGGLVLSATGRLSPFSAAIVHNASTIAVVLNSLRLGKEVAGSNPLRELKEVSI